MYTKKSNHVQRILISVIFLIVICSFIVPTLAVDTTNKIVYERDGIIFLINSDGSNEVRLADGYNPIWSPDGQKIVYISGNLKPTQMTNDPQGYSRNVYAINADGSGTVTILKDIALTQDPSLGYPVLSYSQDGKIAFSYFRYCKGDDCNKLDTITNDIKNKNERSNDPSSVDPYLADYSEQIGIISDTGTNFLHLTNTSDVFFLGKTDKHGILLNSPPQEKYMHCNYFGSCFGGEYYPHFSPDGKKIAYLGAEGSLKLRNAEGSSDPVVIYTPEDKKASYVYFHIWDWSPDGKSILFTAGANYQIQSDGTGLMKIPFGFNPKWSPNGKLIAGMGGNSNSQNSNGLWIMNGDGTGQKCVYTNSVQSFDWSPDSTKIVINGLKIVNLSGGVEDIGNGRENNPKWSPTSNIGSNFGSILGSSGDKAEGNSKQSSGFGSILTICGLTISLIITLFTLKKHP